MPHDTERSQKPTPARGPWPRMPPFPTATRQRGLIGPYRPDQSAGIEGANSGASEAGNQNEEAEDLVRRLEATGDYRVLRRLVPRLSTPAGTVDKVGVILDFESTGLDATRDEIIEAALIKFRYSCCGDVTSIIGTF